MRLPILLAGSLLARATAQDCYGEGERAVGAPGYPEVAWQPCCVGSATSRDGDWGMFCDNAPLPAGACYGAGERSTGAAGFSYVTWMVIFFRISTAAA